MYEYEIMLKSTGEIKTIFGITLPDACHRWNVDYNDVKLLLVHYDD